MGNDTSSVDTQKKPISRNSPNHAVLPSNARLMNTAIKQRLSKGTAKSTYNMKVVIRGDRQTGKSALFHRLEGGGFIKEHRMTEQIQCSHVLWPYKTSDEMVNLEIWDVVDKAIVPTNIVEDNNGIVKPSNVSKNLLPADASTIDVYKGAHAVIFMVDPTRKWTLDYVKTNISEIPDGIDCVVLFGKKDLTKLWTLRDSEIEEFMSSQPKNVRSLQISLQDCYGMKELHSFFNVPFLRMKAKYLQQELARAEREYEQSKVELDIFINHQNYDEFLSRLRALKEQKKGKNKAPSSPVTAPAPRVKQSVRSSKDLPLIQEQQQKEEQKKKEEEERKEQEKKKQENIHSFKPTGNLNDDFFADLGGDDLEDDNDDDKTDEDDLDKPSKPAPIKMLQPVEMNEDDTEDHILQNGHKKEDINSNDKENVANPTDDNKHKQIDIENNNEDQIGFADHELDDPPKSNSIPKGNGHHIEAKSDKMAYSRMPDMKLTESKSSGKLQSLMKLQSAGIEQSDSDEFDVEPLVFAAPKTIHKPKSSSKPSQKILSKAKIVEKPLSPLDLNKHVEPQNDNAGQNAFDAFMNDLGSVSPKSPRSPKSVKSLKSNDDDDDEEDEDEEELDEDALAKKRRKEEKRRRRKEEKKKRKREKKRKKKREKVSEDEDDGNNSESDGSKKKKKKKKKKRKRKRDKDREREKDNDLVEYEDSDGNNSDDIVDIE